MPTKKTKKLPQIRALFKAPRVLSTPCPALGQCRLGGVPTRRAGQKPFPEGLPKHARVPKQSAQKKTQTHMPHPCLGDVHPAHVSPGGPTTPRAAGPSMRLWRDVPRPSARRTAATAIGNAPNAEAPAAASMAAGTISRAPPVPTAMAPSSRRSPAFVSRGCGCGRTWARENTRGPKLCVHVSGVGCPGRLRLRAPYNGGSAGLALI